MQDTDSKCDRAARWIVRLLTDGIEAGPSVMAYIDSTLSSPSFDDLSAFLQDESSCERDTLLDLLFFPDETFQIQMEPLLMQDCYSSREAGTVAGHIARMAPRVPIIFPEKQGRLPVRLPDFAAGALVSRLRMDRKIDPEIATAVSAAMPEKEALRTRVRLRNAGVPGRLNTRGLLVRFFEKITYDETLFEPCLEFLLIFTAGLADTAPVFPALLARKRKLTDQLQKAEKFMTKLQKSNMETLMSQGVRAPGINPEAIKTTLRIIDTIALRVFGRPAPLEIDYAETQRAFSSRPDSAAIKQVIDLLS